MGKKSYTILSASQKGVVGKTIVAINIAAALRSAGYDVLLIDMDVANPSIAPLLGIRSTGKGFAEMLKGKIELEQVQVVYAPVDFYILPSGGSGEAVNPTTEELNKFFAKVKKLNYDFIICDTPPGAVDSGSLKNYDEALIVTTPEETAVYGAQKLSQILNEHHLLHKLVINRVKDDKYELDEDRIEKIYGDIAYAMVPEDRIVTESEAVHTPAYSIDRRSQFALSIDDLCRAYMLKAGEPSLEKKDGGIRKFLGLE